MVSAIVWVGVPLSLFMAFFFGVAGKRMYDTGDVRKGKEKMFIGAANLFLALTLTFPAVPFMESYHAFFLFAFVVVFGFGAYIERQKQNEDAAA